MTPLLSHPCIMKKPLISFSLLALSISVSAQDCQLEIHHTAIHDQHHFQLEVSCKGRYNTLDYLLRASRNRNGTTLINSETSKLAINGDSKKTGEVVLQLRPGDEVLVEARILQACEVLGETTLSYQHTREATKQQSHHRGIAP